MKKFATAMLLASLLGTAAYAQPNMGDQKPTGELPFNMAKVVTFDSQIWRMAFLPDGRILATQKSGQLWLVTQAGQKTPVSGVPAVFFNQQAGLLGVYLSPHYATDHYVYLTYSEPYVEGAAAPAGMRGTAPCPGDAGKVCTAGLAMARAKLTLGNGTASLDGLQVLWRDPAGGPGGQFGAAIAFAPDGNSLFLSSGDRQRMAPAQDPNSPLGKVLHLTLDGKPAPGNPGTGKHSAQTVNVINTPNDTELAKTAPVVRTFTYPASAPNQTVAETWSMGHRTPYGMAFAPNGQLWELEHGPRGGDKLNLIQPGKDYGWPLAGYAPNYNGVPVPSFDGQPNLTRAVIQWTPVIAPGSLTFYKGNLFRGWAGSVFATGMASKSLTRIVLDGKGGATAAERWDVGFGVRDLEVAPDGAIWISEGGQNNTAPGALYRATPK